MAKIQVDIPEALNKSLKMHKIRYNFDTLQDALVDALDRFFATEDYNYFEKMNKAEEAKNIKRGLKSEFERSL